MTLEDIINFANDNKVEFTISVAPDPLTLLLTIKRGDKKRFHGFNLDVLKEEREYYIQRELCNMLRKLEDPKCPT